MLTRAEKSRLLFQTIGWPIGSGSARPSPEVLEEITPFAFKSRVGLLFLDECLRRGIDLGPRARDLHASLSTRRRATDRVMLRLARRLDEVAAGEWVLFKSIKPFAATPNDTDWFPLDPRRHRALVDHLTAPGGGFRWLERAPRQITLVEEGGEGLVDTTKKGGVYYIDCYVAPSTDYFIYMDPRRLRGLVRRATIEGEEVPVLAPHAELAAILFHNVFPEKTFTIESYYLIKRYLDLIEEQGSLADFMAFIRAEKMELACAANLALVREIDRAQFGLADARVATVLVGLGKAGLKVKGFDPLGAFPFAFPAGIFWGVFLSKQRDPTAFLSTLNQGLHMLNPVFLADVLAVIWRRTIRGGVYEQN